MHSRIQEHVALLKSLSPTQLRQRYAEVFGESIHTGNKAWLIKRLAWRLQALAEGGLSERARQRALELAHEANIRLAPPKNRSTSPAPARPSHSDPRLPPPGSMITRFYKGRTCQVRLLLNGFEFDGAVYPSLSAVAKAITGDHCNGFLFFRLSPGGAS